MNTLIYYSFNVLILSIIVLIVGMIKPKWILLWMEKPGRLPIAMIAGVLFMIGAVMYGEGNKQLQAEKAQQSKQEAIQKPGSEVPVPDLH
ncbi:MAG: hypothetical protein LUQ11_09945 [Methylococcaceae bacterium]|nr:hypothetical protein [Methylococcaceae bacterium]